MADGTPTLESLVEEMAQMRAALAAQKDIIARQESVTSSLQERLASPDQTPRADATAVSAAEDADTERAHSFTTSRCGLIRGAAAATAATVGAVALGAGQPAHAAPLADGSNLVLGQANSAASTTTLSDSAGTATEMLWWYRLRRAPPLLQLQDRPLSKRLAAPE